MRRETAGGKLSTHRTPLQLEGPGLQPVAKIWATTALIFDRQRAFPPHPGHRARPLAQNLRRHPYHRRGGAIVGEGIGGVLKPLLDVAALIPH